MAATERRFCNDRASGESFSGPGVSEHEAQQEVDSQRLAGGGGQGPQDGGTQKALKTHFVCILKIIDEATIKYLNFHTLLGFDGLEY
jgi:hypothetical protein